MDESSRQCSTKQRERETVQQWMSHHGNAAQARLPAPKQHKAKQNQAELQAASRLQPYVRTY